MRTIYIGCLRITFLAMLLVASMIIRSNATKHVITVQNFSFSPASVTAALGDTIEWDWINGEHTTTSVTIPGGATAWNNPINAANQVYRYVPAVTGTYNYQCNIHPSLMTGTFTVTCSQPSVSISAGGPTTFCKPGSVVLSQSSGGTFASYQWKKGNMSLAGATTSSYMATKSGSYKLVVTNGCGNSATSNTISLTANPQPASVISPPGPIDICMGQTVTLSANTGANLAYQWRKGMMNISGATNSTLVVGVKGTYKVTVTNTATGCSKLSTAVKVNVTCKESLATSEMRVYPNPSSDYFVLNTSSIQSPGSFVNIYDLTGKLMERVNITAEATEVGASLPAGVYLAKIEVNGNIEQLLKLVKLQ